MTREFVWPFFHWLDQTPLADAIKSSAILIALTQIVHLLGLTLLAGTILMTDTALLGFGFRRHPASRVAAELAPWTLTGLVILLLSGPLILSSEAKKCYDSTFFWMKMAALAAAIVFHFAVHLPVARAETPAPRWRRMLVAGVSLTLWFGVAVTGKMIGIYGDDLRREDPPGLEGTTRTSTTRMLAIKAQPPRNNIPLR